MLIQNNFHMQSTITSEKVKMYVHVVPSRDDFNSEENIKKWSVVFINTLKEIQSKTHPFLKVKQEGLHYVVSLLLRLLNALLNPPTNSNINGPIPILSSVIIEERIQCLFPRPLKKRAIRKGQEASIAFKNNKKLRGNSFFNQNDRLHLKTPLENFHHLLQREILPCKIEVQVSQYILAVLEFIASDILQLTGHYVRNMTHSEINPQDIRVAMCADKVLMDLFYSDVDEVAHGPPPSAGYHYHQSFFSDSSDIPENENVNTVPVTYLDKVKELVHDERQFLRDLQMVIKVFREPLNRILTFDEAQQLFWNIEDVYNFSHNFLFSLEETYEAANEDEDPNIGYVFEDFAEGQEFDVFEKYANNLLSFPLRENLYKILTPHEAEFAHEPGLYPALRHVLPQFLHVPVFHCFSYFKTIQNLKERTVNHEDRESFGQAEALLLPLKTELEKFTKSSKFNKSFMLRPCDRTNRAQSLAKMTAIQRSIDGWQGKDIGQSCNEFILEGQLMKVTGQHRGRRLTDRHAFLFDGLIVLCKPYTKRTSISVTGRDTSATTCDWRLKERYLIRNIEINDCDESITGGSHSGQSNGDHSPLYSEQSFSSLTSSIVNLSMSSSSMNLFDGSGSVLNLRNAFMITPRNEQPIILIAKSSEEKDQWISQLILLNTRPMLERTLDGKLQEEAKKHPLQLPNPNQYRFAIEDDDSNIILEENKGDSNVPCIKGATLLKLIERLTYHAYGDPIFVRNFLTTYRSFCTPTDLLKLMIERFEIPEPDFKSCMQAMHFANEELSSPTSIHPPPEAIAVGGGTVNFNSSSCSGSGTDENHIGIEGSDRNPTSPINCQAPSLLLSSHSSLFGEPFDETNEQLQKDYREMLKRFRKEYAQPVQYRVVNVFRHWIDNHYYDFERDPQLLKDLTDFLNSKSTTKGTPLTKNMRKMLEHCLKVLERKADQSEEVREFVQTQLPPPIEWFITKEEKEFNIITLHPIELARQLTLLEFDLYRAVKPSELVGTEGKSGIWTKKDKQKTSPNLVKMTKHNTNFIRYLEKSIVETQNFEERVAVVVRIIEVMMVLQELNNFNGVFEVHSALKSASCHRLEHTLSALDKSCYSKHKKALDEAQELIHDHSKKYIEKLKSINPPCVPFFGTYLSNILKIEEGNKEYLSTPIHLENMSLHESSGELCEEVVSAKLINFSKKTKVASITGEIQQYQDTPYVHKVEPSIRHWLENLDPTEGKTDNEFEEYLFNKSLEIEPRGAKQPLKAAPVFNQKYLKSPGIKQTAILAKSNHQNKSNANRINSVFIDPLISNFTHKDGSTSVSNVSFGFLHSSNTPNSAPNGSESPMSPATSLTPPQSASFNNSHLNEAIFAPVMIGGGSNTLPYKAPSASPVSTPNHYNGQYSGQRFFPPHSHTLPTAPPPPSQYMEACSMVSSNLSDSRSPPPLPPRPRTFAARPRSVPVPVNEESSDIDGPPPPLPPRTYKPSTSQSANIVSARSAARTSFPLSPHANDFIPSSGVSTNSNEQLPYIHQRFSSDNILHSANIGSSSTLVRRNSANLEPLPPRRFSTNPPPPPLPPMPSSPLHTPVTPPSSGGLATTPLESSYSMVSDISSLINTQFNRGPELPPKTYRHPNV